MPANAYNDNPYATYMETPPEQIIAIHEPWHGHYRFALEDKLSPDELREIGFPDYLKAADALEGYDPMMINPGEDSLTESEIVDKFSHGFCPEYAIALNEITGLPMVALWMKSVFGRAYGRDFAHVFVSSRPRYGIDVKGERLVSKIIKEQEEDAIANGVKGAYFETAKISRRSLEATTGSTGINQEMIDIARADISTRLRAQGDIVSNPLIFPAHMSEWMLDSKVSAVVTMDPEVFLNLTTNGSRHFDQIVRESQSLDEYNTYAAEGNTQIPPFLKIDIDSFDLSLGKIVSHEGRHRAAALMQNGESVMPVAIILSQNFVPSRQRTVLDMPLRWVDEFTGRMFIASDFIKGILHSNVQEQYQKDAAPDMPMTVEEYLDLTQERD
jgi:hypothetical protein